MSKIKKGSEDALSELHNIVTQEITKLVKGDPSAKNLEVAMKFLKDNCVKADIGIDEALKELQDRIDKQNEEQVDVATLPFSKTF